jgi:glycoprotein endo-alpha-1,2-mannosidase
LPHWTEQVNKNFPTVGSHHSPPEIIHSPFYPLRNPYSSRNPEVILEQFEDMLTAGGNVAVVSWWGQASKSYSTDTQGVCTDKIIDEILNVADRFGKIKIAFHLEPYPSRTVESVRDDVEYILNKYGNHSSIYRARDGRPLFYVYDSYHIFPSQWRRMLQPDGDLTVRGTALDGYFIGLWLDRLHGRDADEAGFDGIYTYFATDGFSYGSTSSNWKSMCDYCRSVGMLCVLSVGPGYDDTSIRPWNAHNVRDRRYIIFYRFSS